MITEGTAEEAKSILETVVSSGTGTNAQIGAEGQWGKTGTTENNGDAWFCGGVDDEVTACVWVGYADTTTPMTTLYNGGPVMGGTFPALIWASVISAWEEIKAERAAESASKKASERSRRTARAGERPNTCRRTVEANANRAEEADEAAPEAEAAPEDAEARRKRPRRSRARSGPPNRRRGGGVTAGERQPGRSATAGGRETKRLPAAQKRQGRSTALVIPIRGPVTTSARPGLRAAAAGTGRRRGRRRCARGRSRAPRSACRGPSRGRRRGARRGARASRSSPAVGSSARISTAAASPSGSQTTLSRLWMP